MENSNKEIRIALFDDHINIYQQAIFQHIENKLKNNKIKITVVNKINNLLKIINLNEVDFIFSEFNYLINKKEIWNISNKNFNRACKNNHVKNVLFVSEISLFLLDKLVNLEFDVMIGIDDDISELDEIMKISLGGDDKDIIPFISTNLKRNLYNHSKSQDKTLSPCEWEVVCLITQGYTISDIAMRKNRALSTIATQKHNAMKKLNISNNSELIKYIISFQQDNGITHAI